MAYADQVTTEINAVLDQLANEGRPWVAEWIANAVCATHRAGLAKKSKHSHFWYHCGHAEVRDQVRRCIAKRTDPQADDDQAPKLPGFEHLQQYYSVKRGDEEIGVPVHDLTDAEIDEKCARLRRMALTCVAHANELERFKNQRGGRDEAGVAA